MSPFLFMTVVLYLILAIAYVERIPEWYAMITMYVAFKWIANYRKCTLSYGECKLRGVSKENGWLYRYLEELVDLRSSIVARPLLLLQALVLLRFYYGTQAL